MSDVTDSLDDGRGRDSITTSTQSSAEVFSRVFQRPTNNLPMQLSSFIGRKRESAEIKRLLATTRVLTLTGAGGCGKTRLALRVASDVIDSFNDGVWWVELAALADETLVPQAIAQTLGVREVPNQTLSETLANHLRAKELLLVIDNCEHLITACAQLTEQLLRACSNVSILTTSREALGIAGETAWTVPSLSLPDVRHPRPTFADVSQYEAVQLFVDRAMAVQPSFKLTELNAAAVAQVCQRLDGIPLAIELAAARVKVLKTAEIAARLDDCFHLLTGGSRTALPRHQTLRAAIDWSYDLLTEPERVLLRRLSVFAGGCTLEAAEQVCADEVGRDGILSYKILDLQSHLVDKSLAVVDKQGGETRYHMLETIRQYAHERLAASGETEAIRRRHAEFFTAWVKQIEMELRAGPTQLDRFAQLEVEHDNIRATLEWSLGGADVELGLRLVGAIFYFWWRGGHWVEWEYWMTLAPAHLDHVSEATRAGSLIALAGLDRYIRHDDEAVRRHSREALTIYRQIGDHRNTAWAMFWLSICMWGNEEEYDECMNLTEEGISILRQEGDLGAVAQGLTNLGLNAQAHGDLIRAKAAHQESLAIARAIGDKLRESIQLSNLGQIAVTEGDYETAAMLFKQFLLWAREHGNSPQMLSGLTYLSGVLGLRGQPQRAAQLVGALDILSDSWGLTLQPEDQSIYDRHVASVRGQLGDEAFETLRSEGQAMTLEQAIEYALETPAPREVAAQPRTLRQTAKQEVGGLTAREREVAALIAQGKSNREIAEAMTVGVKTVETYVTRILNKLGFDSRVQIATWAVEKGLR